MSKAYKLGKRLLLSSLVFWLYSFNVGFADTITLVADDWCPYNCVPGSKRPGYVVEVAREIFKKSGHKVIYKYKPWERALLDVSEGKDNGAIAANLESMPLGVFNKEPIGMYAMAYFVVKGNSWSYQNVSSLKNQRIGAVSGYTYGEPFDGFALAHQKNIHFLHGVEPTPRLLTLLTLGRVDMFIEDKDVATYLINLKGLQEHIVNAGFNGDSHPVYIGFSQRLKESAGYAKVLSRGIIEMRKNGRLQKVLDKYNLSDWK